MSPRERFAEAAKQALLVLLSCEMPWERFVAHMDARGFGPEVAALFQAGVIERGPGGTIRVPSRLRHAYLGAAAVRESREWAEGAWR